MQLKNLTPNNSGHFQLISKIFAQLFCLCCCHFGSVCTWGWLLEPWPLSEHINRQFLSLQLNGGYKKGMKGPKKEWRVISRFAEAPGRPRKSEKLPQVPRVCMGNDRSPCGQHLIPKAIFPQQLSWNWGPGRLEQLHLCRFYSLGQVRALWSQPCQEVRGGDFPWLIPTAIFHDFCLLLNISL